MRMAQPEWISENMRRSLSKETGAAVPKVNLEEIKERLTNAWLGKVGG